MSTTEAEIRRPVPAWRRMLVATGWVSLLTVLVGAGVYVFNRHRLVSRLERVMKELDESDPGWRWPTALQGRPELPLEENGAARTLSIVRSLPRVWPDPKQWETIHELPPNADLDGVRRKTLDELLGVAPVPRLRAEARGLVRYPRGRIDLTLNENAYSVLLPDHQSMRQAANLLQLDAHDLAQAGRYGEALEAARACLNVSRALDDDPFLICHMIRAAIASVAMNAAERTMALGDAPDDALALLQKELSHEAARTGLEAAMRGERAATHQMLTLMSSGKLTLHELENMTRMGGVAPEWWGLRWYRSLTGREMARREHADILQLMTKSVDAARLPTMDQFAAEDEIDREIKSISRGQVSRLVLMGGQMARVAARRVQSQAAAMRALIAVERYRQKHGKWPGKLENVVPAFLDKVPLDPIDGRPVRYGRWADGVVVYSVGDDRKDDGGDVARPFKDFGHRLWDPAKRRAAPPPLPPGAAP